MTAVTDQSHSAVTGTATVIPDQRRLTDPNHPDRPNHSNRPDRSASTAERIGWSLVALLVSFTGNEVWGGSLSIPGANLVGVGLILGGLLTVWWAWVRPHGLSTRVQLLLLSALAVGVSYQAVMMWLVDPSYGTDAIAFDQYSASLALHGLNPYTHSMAPSVTIFHVPAIFHTFRLDGTTVNALSYPAGSFLPYMPLLALGVTTQAANIVDLAFWLAGMFLFWRLLPRDSRWAAGIVGAATTYIGFVIGGLTDALFIPFVLLAVYRWDRFALGTTRGWARWGGPLALGAAISIKQTPWFLVPYILLGLFFEARAAGRNPWKTVGQYTAVLTAVFTAVNITFFAADPAAWIKGSLVPFLDPTIPDGQGLVNLTIFEHLGGGNLKWFTVLGMIFVLATFAAYTLRYTSLKRAWVPLVAVSFFLPTRSFGSYLFMLIPTAIVAATSVQDAPGNPFPNLTRRWKPILGVSAAGLLAAAAFALTSTAPLTIHVEATRSTGQLQTLDEVTVQVHNRTGNPIQPHFTVNSNDHATTFWYILGANGETHPVIGAHRTVTLRLHAPNTASMPGVTSPLLVEAFTAKPATISVSGKYLVSAVNTRITPDGYDHPIPVGQPVTMTVQIENRYGGRIRKAGVPVTLGQTVYGQNNYFPGESSINGRPEGQSPVIALTDPDGTATFTIVGRQAQEKPITYQSFVADSGIPHGYSGQVSIQFVAAGR